MHDCHSGYISFYGAFLSDPNICICMEFMDKGSLDGIYKQGPIDIKVVTKVAYAMLEGLTYSGLGNCCNVWGFWTGGGVALGGVGISLSAGWAI